MKARVKSWEDIVCASKPVSGAVINGNSFRVTDGAYILRRTIRVFEGIELNIESCEEKHHPYHYVSVSGFIANYWHRDWLEIIDENEEIAEIYALLLIKSGEI